MVNWDAPDIIEWKKKARDLQQSYCDALEESEWHHIGRGNETILLRKIGYGLYGNPPALPKADNLETGYEEKQLKHIKLVKDNLTVGINMNTEGIHFACVFVVAKLFDQQFTEPVFKAKAEKSATAVYVDATARKYESWTTYLNDNVLPKCLYCYPSYGKYEYEGETENVNVMFGTSPACDLTSRTANVLDNVATVAALGATVVGVVSLFAIPVAGPILLASTIAGTSSAVYGTGRTTYALVDRATHGQSIDPVGSSEARLCWLSLIGSGLGMAQGAMLRSMTSMAKAGDVMSKAGRIAFFVVQTGSLTVNGIGIINGLVVLIEKKENNTLTPLDVFQFSASVLFFTNSAVNFKTAGTIIKEVQHEVINSHRDALDGKNAKKLFNKQTGKLRGRDELHGNAKVVKQLNKIENSKDLFEMMVNKNINNRKVKMTPDGFKGNLVVNKNLKIHPLKMQQILPEARQSIYTSTKSFETKQITKDQFHKEMRGVCREYRISFESMREDTASSVKNITVNGRKIFSNPSPHELDRMAVVLSNTTNNDSEIIAMATAFAEKADCRTASDYIAFTEYFVADLNDSVKTMEKNYTDGNRDFAAARSLPTGAGRQARKVHFKNEVLNQYREGSAGYDDLVNKFNALKQDVSFQNSQCSTGFFNDNNATYHYVKHKHFGTTEMTTEQYFAVAEEVVGQPTNQTNSMLSQDGSVTMITYKDPQQGVVAVVIQRNSAGEGTGIATVMYDPRIKDK